MSLPRFTFDLEDELQNSESKVANPANLANRAHKVCNIRRIRNIRNQADLILKDNSGHITQGEPSWKKFYPDLAPADFEITETTGGVAGRKIRGTMVGTVGFFIPWGMLEKGPRPPTNRKSPTRTEWNFSRLHMPSQSNPGHEDVWMWGERVDPPKLKWWFVETVNGSRDPEPQE